MGATSPSMHWAVVVLLRRRDDQLERSEGVTFVCVPLISVPSGTPREGVPPREEGLVPVQDGESREESIPSAGVRRAT